MKFKFRSTKLEKCYRDSQRAEKSFGQDIGRTFIRRIDQIAALDKLSDFYRVPQFHFHPLKGKRAGQYAIRLSGMMRLIVTFEEGSEPVLWIEEVSKHYGD